MANNRNRNRLEIPGAQDVMNQLKLEVAQELGIQNYDEIDKGALPARVHGKVGGLMVRKMIEYAEAAMKQDQNALASVEAQHGANQEDIDTVQAYVTNAVTPAQAVQNPGVSGEELGGQLH